MKKKNIKLICKAVGYYTSKDEDAFFEWLKKIPSIVEVEGWSDELHLYIKSSTVPVADLREIIAIFFRYNIKDMTQLKIFLNQKNKEWFFDNPYAYWHEKVFAEPRIKLVCDSHVFGEDENGQELFVKNAKEITSVDQVDDFIGKLDLYTKGAKISDSDLMKLVLLFHENHFDMKQFSVFLNDENKIWFFDKEAVWYDPIFGTSKIVDNEKIL
ncbi:hypothetical protein KAH94_05425 [bacterium]|nr:hypothetical protein [bacterium]